jgi:hypothetical protein
MIQMIRPAESQLDPLRTLRAAGVVQGIGVVAEAFADNQIPGQSKVQLIVVVKMSELLAIEMKRGKSIVPVWPRLLRQAGNRFEPFYRRCRRVVTVSPSHRDGATSNRSRRLFSASFAIVRTPGRGHDCYCSPRAKLSPWSGGFSCADARLENVSVTALFQAPDAGVSFSGPLVVHIVEILGYTRLRDVGRHDDVWCNASFPFVAQIECLPTACGRRNENLPSEHIKSQSFDRQLSLPMASARRITSRTKEIRHP